MDKLPIIYFHILAKDKAKLIDYWLEQNLDKIDYPKDRIRLFFRTNNNNDDTQFLIQGWIDDQELKGVEWYSIDWDFADVPEQVQNYGVHEWNPERFKVLGKLRQEGIDEAYALDCDYYYVCDVDNFVLPHTLRTLVNYNLPVVSPMLKMADPEQPAYSNYHLLTNVKGYYLDEMRYYQVLKQEVKGLIACDVVHCTYLIRKDILPQIKYLDGTDDYEYVIFSRNLRASGTPQYLDNQQIYGCLSTRENLEACQKMMNALDNGS